jgi:hypothetical protein
MVIGLPYHGRMEVRVGPVSARSATAWVGYATDVLTSAVGNSDVPTVDPDIVAEFIGYLNQWEHHAAHGDPFIWTGEIEPERLEYLVHGFARIVDHLAAMADRRDEPNAPAEGDDFYQALVLSIIDALAQQGDSMGEFSEQLRDQWPGLHGD